MCENNWNFFFKIRILYVNIFFQEFLSRVKKYFCQIKKVPYFFSSLCEHFLSWQSFCETKWFFFLCLGKCVNFSSEEMCETEWIYIYFFVSLCFFMCQTNWMEFFQKYFFIEWKTLEGVWPWTLGHDRKNKIQDTSGRNEFPPQGGGAGLSPLEIGWGALSPGRSSVSSRCSSTSRGASWDGHLFRMPPGRLLFKSLTFFSVCKTSDTETFFFFFQSVKMFTCVKQWKHFFQDDFFLSVLVVEKIPFPESLYFSIVCLRLCNILSCLSLNEECVIICAEPTWGKQLYHKFIY